MDLHLNPLEAFQARSSEARGWMAPLMPLLFVHAHGLLERGVCQGAFARDRQGKETATTLAEACSWSLIGALYRAAVEVLPPGHNTLQTRFLLIDEAAALLCETLKLKAADSLPRFALGAWCDEAGRLPSQVLGLVASVVTL